MTTFIAPHAGVDAIASATPLRYTKGGAATPFPGCGICSSATSAAAWERQSVLALFNRQGVPDGTPRDFMAHPCAYLGTVALVMLLSGQPGMILFRALRGRLMLGAFFYGDGLCFPSSSPEGWLVFGIGCGVVTMVVRLWGGYPEGVSFSILFMNLLTPLAMGAPSKSIQGR